MKSIVSYIAVMIVGSVLVYVSRALPRHNEGEWKWNIWTSEFTQGQPGYLRAILTILGSALMIIGLVGLIIKIVS